MNTQPTTQDRIYRAQAAARLDMLRRMRRELLDDISRLDDAIDLLRDRDRKLSAEIRAEESQWEVKV